MIPQISAQARGLVAATANKAGCSLSKGPDRVRVYVSCNKVGNPTCL
jgi:hypothetical protein